jgi:hypothetical protein
MHDHGTCMAACAAALLWPQMVLRLAVNRLLHCHAARHVVEGPKGVAMQRARLRAVGRATNMLYDTATYMSARSMRTQTDLAGRLMIEILNEPDALGAPPRLPA